MLFKISLISTIIEAYWVLGKVSTVLTVALPKYNLKLKS